MSRHPHFVSPLAWHHRLDEALAEASAQHKRVLVQHGRQSCTGSRSLVERTLAKEEIVEFIAKHFVLLASDADAPEPRIADLVASLPRQAPTPLCIYLSAGGQLLSSTAGGRPPAVLLNDLLDASTKR
jgi:hypothetical protein